ncbi:MAG: glycosyltransferase family 4 protein [Candidatus Doudnabacteria bacterium]|nr:glycosyltransferase family 4 protein [Candidatus Doudnabacteria bacterium]
MAGTGEGIARYVEELVAHLSQIDLVNEYYLLVDERVNFNFQISNDKFHAVRAKSPYYSWREQTLFVWELLRLKLDLVHFPSFNVPIFYPGKFIVTIHDLIHHRFPGKKRGRALHRLAYRAVMWTALKRARHIIAVSQATRRDLEANFKISPAKIAVIYEGVAARFREAGIPNSQFPIPKLYILFVGVWRQYKNLPRLARAFDILKERWPDLKLVLAGKIDPYYPEIKNAVMAARHAADIKPLEYVSEEELLSLYRGAQLLVIPSLTEGFGLIGIEAQACGTPVASSDTPVLHEVLGGGAVYFNPESEQDIAEKINGVLQNPDLKRNLRQAALDNSKRFDWQKTAAETLAIYERERIK